VILTGIVKLDGLFPALHFRLDVIKRGESRSLSMRIVAWSMVDYSAEVSMDDILNNYQKHPAESRKRRALEALVIKLREANPVLCLLLATAPSELTKIADESGRTYDSHTLGDHRDLIASLARDQFDARSVPIAMLRAALSMGLRDDQIVQVLFISILRGWLDEDGHTYAIQRLEYLTRPT